MEPKIDQKLFSFQAGVPEGPRGRFWKDFGPILELFWDDFSEVFGRMSMLGLIVFKVLASSFWGRWWEISLCCCHPLECDLGVVLYVVCHVLHMFIDACTKYFAVCDCFHVWRDGKSLGLVCCDWSGLLTCGLVSFVRFGLPGMVSYGLDHLF